MAFLRLSQITERINNILQEQRVIGTAFWIKAEISSGRERGGAFYCDLVETSPHGGITAQMRCTIWGQHLNVIKSKFQRAGIKLQLENGTVAGFQCMVQFHPQYGLSLQVIDADPSATLGEMELKKREIIARLQSEGLFEINKTKIVPLLPKTIGLISSDDSAAYNDFLKTLQNSNIGIKIFFSVSSMQGDKTEPQVLKGLKRLTKLKPDLIVIIRGGGSKTDLSYLDNEKIARTIASCPIPVWIGIGHEIDQSVLDFVANRPFKTPTAVAEEIVAKYTAVFRYLEESTQRLKSTWTFRLTQEKEYIPQSINGIQQGTRKHLENAKNKLKLSAHELSESISKRISGEKVLLERTKGALMNLSKEHLKQNNSIMDDWMKRLKNESQRVLSLSSQELVQQKKRFNINRFIQIISSEHQKLETQTYILKAFDPETTLKRGYALLQNSDGSLIRSAHSIEKGVVIKTQLHDGSFNSTVNDVTKDSKDGKE